MTKDDDTGRELKPTRRRLRPVLAVAGLLIFQNPPSPAMAQAVKDSGISFGEYQRRFPQAPRNVRAEIRAGKIVISWDRPQPGQPREKLSYDPVVDHYRVYRIGPDETQHLIGETDRLLFEVGAAERGAVARYAVSAVQKSGVESGRSETVEARVP